MFRNRALIGNKIWRPILRKRAILWNNNCFDCPLIWSTSQIVEGNVFFRNFDDYKDIFMPFNNLLFFSDAGNGDLFAFAILNGSIRKGDIYVWNHEDDSRMWIASSLEEFIRGWSTGKISI